MGMRSTVILIIRVSRRRYMQLIFPSQSQLFNLHSQIPVACPESSDQNIQPTVQSRINHLEASWGYFTAFGELNVCSWFGNPYASPHMSFKFQVTDLQLLEFLFKAGTLSHLLFLIRVFWKIWSLFHTQPLIITVGHTALTVGVFISVRNHTSQLQVSFSNCIYSLLRYFNTGNWFFLSYCGNHPVHWNLHLYIPCIPDNFHSQ